MAILRSRVDTTSKTYQANRVGQLAIALETMKMEPRFARLSAEQAPVVVGAQVDSGAVLAVVEEDTDD